LIFIVLPTLGTVDETSGTIVSVEPFNMYQYYLIALLIAPLGAILRWQLGAKFNGRIWFPIGTFIANVLGVLLDAIAYGIYDRQNVPYPYPTENKPTPGILF